MFESHHPSLLRLSCAAQATLIAGARDNEPVRGLTHSFYKYPARFSPIFARAAIEAFTQPGDLVLLALRTLCSVPGCPVCWRRHLRRRSGAGLEISPATCGRPA